MKKLLLCILALATLLAPPLRAQAPIDLAGNWQGSLEGPQTRNAPGGKLRLVIKIEKADAGTWKTTFYSIDQPGQGFNATTTVQGPAVKFVVTVIGGTFEGKLSPEGNTIAGTWAQGSGESLPLILVRATPATAWEIPAPPPPEKPMAADADPSFEVATIKPNASGATSMQGLNISNAGHTFTTRASSLEDLITFAYNLHAKQIIGDTEWMAKDRYDILATIDTPGVPNVDQIRSMVKKLLADRFKLTFHHEKRDLSAFVLSVAKGGQKLTPTELKGALPGMGMRPGPTGLTLMVRNGTLQEFTSFLQMLVLDRPVVDHTGIPGKFDLQITFTPDDSLFNGHPPPLPPPTDAAAPNLFTAIQQQVGLKLDAEKTPIDVIVIDHVEKPSPN